MTDDGRSDAEGRRRRRISLCVDLSSLGVSRTINFCQQQHAGGREGCFGARAPQAPLTRDRRSWRCAAVSQSACRLVGACDGRDWLAAGSLVLLLRVVRPFDFFSIEQLATPKTNLLPL